MGRRLNEGAEALAAALDVAFTDLQTAVAALKSRGVVLPRGRYLYVSPDLLAVSAAASLWTERGSDLIHVAEALPGTQPRMQMLIRLAMIREHESVKEAGGLRS